MAKWHLRTVYFALYKIMLLIIIIIIIIIVIIMVDMHRRNIITMRIVDYHAALRTETSRRRSSPAAQKQTLYICNRVLNGAYPST